MIYAYKARDAMGRVVEGELDCADELRLLEELKGRALKPVHFRVVRESPSKGNFSRWKGSVQNWKGSEPRIEESLRREEPILSEDEAIAAEAPSTSGGGRIWSVLILLYILYKIFSSFM